MLKNNLQSVFACLATHSKWVKAARNEALSLATTFNLTDSDAATLQAFMQEQGKRVWIAAVLGEEKRWRDMLPVIRSTYLILGEAKLRVVWQDYLQSYSIETPIPVNPLAESVNFLKVLMHTKHELLEENIIHYEYLQNSVLLSEESVAHTLHSFDFDQYANHYNYFIAKLNPSLMVHEFGMSLATAIKEMRSRDFKPDSTKETIAFYKPPYQQGVKSTKISAPVAKLLNELPQFQDLGDLITQVAKSQKTTASKSLEFIKALYNSGIIYITSLKEDDYVQHGM